jgi:hypothetical protein
MPYKLYTDKPEDFTCEISVKNASLKGSMARLIIESSDGVNFVFNGKIEGGKCIVPIKKLKGLLNENERGNMYLEIIVEDTYFRPWKSDFSVEEHTSVKVRVNEAKISNKPTIEVWVPKTEKKVIGINVWLPLHEITNICRKLGINRSTLSQRKSDFQQLIREYFKFNPEFKTHKSVILNGLKYFLK